MLYLNYGNVYRLNKYRILKTEFIFTKMVLMKIYALNFEVPIYNSLGLIINKL
jgi:hypothetical protein